MNREKGTKCVTASGLAVIVIVLALGGAATAHPGVGTPGYWINHPDAWPQELQDNGITIGGVWYSQAEAIEIMGSPVKGDKTYTLFRAFVATLLNISVGNTGACVLDAIVPADNWLINNPLGSGVAGSSCAWQCGGECLYLWLDDYNNGLLCDPSRDVVETWGVIY